MPRIVSNIEIASSPTTSTSSVLKDRCTSTLSMTTWKNSGETRANSCRKNDATSTSLEEMSIFVDRSQEPGDVETAGDVRQAAPAGHQDQLAVPDRDELGPRHQSGPGCLR